MPQTMNTKVPFISMKSRGRLNYVMSCFTGGFYQNTMSGFVDNTVLVLVASISGFTMPVDNIFTLRTES